MSRSRSVARAWPMAILLVSSVSCREATEVVAPIRLFNGQDLSGWTVFLDPSTEGGRPGAGPPCQVFEVEDGMIHVSGERFGGLTTKDEFSNYRLSLEFRWGEKKWPPRENAVRDSGVLLHCVGPDKIWTRSIECQIQEHDCGDFWMVDGTSMEIDGKVETGGP